MKKTIFRLVAAVMVLVLLASAIAGCKKTDDDEPGSGNNGGGNINAPETPEFIYMPEYISLPDSIADLSNLTVIGDKLYFSSQIMDYDSKMYSSYTVKLFSMNFDGTGLTELVNYSSNLRPEDAPEDAMGYESIMGLSSDFDGNIWVAESGQFYGFDLPDDFDEMTDNMYEYYYDVGNFTALRKLDTTGAELLSVDISSLADETEYFYLSNFNIDGDGNIYLGIQSTIFVLNESGRVHFKLEVMNWVDQLVKTSDGSVAFSGYAERGRSFRKIDFAARDWGEEIDMPQNANRIYPGGGEYGFIFNDNNNLFGYDEALGESVKLLNWIDSDISPDGLENINFLPDGRILCTTYSWGGGGMFGRAIALPEPGGPGGGGPGYELIILTKVPYDSIPPRTILTLACMWMDWTLRNAVVNFNKTNGQYRIQVNDYSEFNSEDDWQAGITRLSTEIISGNVPDILLTSNLPFNQYAAKGLLEDLYPFIDADSGFSRGDFIESAFRATEVNGSLYQIFPNFSVTTLIGHPSVLGREMGWNMDEFMAVLRANPQATKPMGMYETKSGFLQNALTMGMDEYVDWAAGRTHFDNGEFAKLLEFANTFPEEYVWNNDDVYVSDFDMVMSGEQIMMTFGMSDFRNASMYTALFGGEIVYKGFPSASRNGNILSINTGVAMTTRCADKEGAWQFMRTILTADWQRSNMRWNYPTNKAVFNEMLEEAMTPQTYIDEDGNEVEISQGSWGWGTDQMIEIFALKQSEADQILELIDSVAGAYSYDESLSTIVMEGAADFFSGRSSAQDAARVIQSRASIYVAEQS